MIFKEKKCWNIIHQVWKLTVLMLWAVLLKWNAWHPLKNRIWTFTEQSKQERSSPVWMKPNWRRIWWASSMFDCFDLDCCEAADVEVNERFLLTCNRKRQIRNESVISWVTDANSGWEIFAYDANQGTCQKEWQWFICLVCKSLQNSTVFTICLTLKASLLIMELTLLVT